MTGYESKKKAALDEEGMYLVHHTQPTQEPRLDQGPDYERGFVDGMQKQMQSSVDKAVNRIAQELVKFNCTVVDDQHPNGVPLEQWGNPPAQPAQEPVAKVCHDLEGHIGWNPKLTELPPEGTELFTAAQPAQERNFCPRCGKRTADLTVIHTCTPPQEKNT